MKHAALLFALFALAYTAKQDPAADKLNAAYCYVNANSGDGTDLEIAEAIGKNKQFFNNLK